ncbi:hypothetical protein ACLKA6_000735 [Drosophila palustris]
MDRVFKIDEEDEKSCCSHAQETMLKLEKVEERLSNLEKTMERKMEEMKNIILNTNSKIIALMEQQRRSMITPKSEFPIYTTDRLAEINDLISESPNNYIELFKRLLNPEGIGKNIERIFSRDLIMKMNYAGSIDKVALEKYESLNKALYEATKREGHNFIDYRREVRDAFHKAKNRCYKASAKEKKNQKRRLHINF